MTGDLMKITSLPAAIMACSMFFVSACYGMHTSIYQMVIFMDEIGKELQGITDQQKLIESAKHKLNNLIEECKKIVDYKYYQNMKNTGEEIKKLCDQVNLEDVKKIEAVIKKYAYALSCILAYEKTSDRKNYSEQYTAMSKSRLQLHDDIHQIKTKLGHQAKL